MKEPLPPPKKRKEEIKKQQEGEKKKLYNELMKVQREKPKTLTKDDNT